MHPSTPASTVPAAGRLLLLAGVCSVLAHVSGDRGDTGGVPLLWIVVELGLLVGVHRWRHEVARLCLVLLSAFGAVLYTGSALTGSRPWFVPVLCLVMLLVLHSAPVRAHVGHPAPRPAA